MILKTYAKLTFVAFGLLLVGLLAACGNAGADEPPPAALPADDLHERFCVATGNETSHAERTCVVRVWVMFGQAVPSPPADYFTPDPTVLDQADRTCKSVYDNTQEDNCQARAFIAYGGTPITTHNDETIGLVPDQVVDWLELLAKEPTISGVSTE